MIMDCLATGTTCLGEYKVKQSMKFDGIIRQQNKTTKKTHMDKTGSFYSNT